MEFDELDLTELPEIDGMAPEKGRRAAVLQLYAANAVFTIKGKCGMPIGAQDAFGVCGDPVNVTYDKGGPHIKVDWSNVLLSKANVAVYHVAVIEVIETGPTLCVRTGTWCRCEGKDWGSCGLEWSEFAYHGPYLVQWLPESKGGLTEQLCEAIAERRGDGQ